jgi:aminoglycoside phosphotransferase (APT) family kinase protein
VESLSSDPAPLLVALERLPATSLHGDLKLANVALLPDGTTAAIDWQMVARAPVALEIGWFLVANVAQLPDTPDGILERYREALVRAGGLDLMGAWEAQRDLALVIGLLLRGWRKGLDAEAGMTLPTGTKAADDLAWWSAEAVAAAGRRL